MTLLITGLVLFFAAHLAPTAPGLRDGMVERIGLNPYKLAFSLASLAGLVLICMGVSAFRGTPADIHLWSPPLWTRHLAFALMLFAFVSIVSAYIPSHIRDRVRHPMLLAIKIWAAAHLLANGDLLALLLFGSFLAFAVFDRISVKRRALAPQAPTQGYAGDAAAVLIGVALWAATLFWLHGLAGVPLL
jgi:uncharacterized membrane protein